MTGRRVGSGALLGLSERTALENRKAFEKEKPVRFERTNWSPQESEVDEH